MMLGGSFWGGPIGDNDHLARERQPPPRPIKLEFPEYVPTFNPRSLTRKLSSRLQHKICHSKTFLDVSDADFESMNVDFEKDVTISSLLPDDQFLCRPLLFDSDLQAMLDEVSFENEDAFREVLRQPPLPGRSKPKLAYARNFFGSVEDMARYFDDSKDIYYRVPTQATDGKAEPKLDGQASNINKDVEMQAASGDNAVEGHSDTKEVYTGYRISSAESLSSGTRLAVLKNLLKTTMHRFQCRDYEPMPQPREKLVVRGVKIQSIQYQFCVARIPQDTKSARARNAEGPIMAVYARDELRFKEKVGLQNPDKAPFMGERFDLFREIGCMLILATQRARQGKDKTINNEEKWWISKQRWGGGPTKWGQLAIEVYEDDDPSWSPEERKLREEKKIQQANDKARGIDDQLDPNQLVVDNLIAHKGNPDATKPIAISRGTTFSAITAPPPGPPTDLDLRPRKKKIRSMDRPSGIKAITHDGKKVMYTPPFKERWYTEWTKLRANTSTIDDRLIGKKIGAPDHTPFDEVFTLTGVNHHVALVKMKVHPSYLSWLENGDEVPDDATADASMKQNVLYVRRTRWFDLFDVKDRQEFLVGLWRVFCWLNREYIPEEEYEKMRRLQEGQQDVLQMD